MSAVMQQTPCEYDPDGVMEHHMRLPPKPTAIQAFYSGKNVFITGATGFLGKVLMEKLLWSCLDIGNIYILVREKKGKSIEVRVEEMCDSHAFTRLKRDRPGFKDKIKGISGDCSEIDLGISAADRALLVNEVNIVFHVAATVRFDEAMPFAMSVNVRATQSVLDMCKDMRSLSSFLHVSTAFCQCYTTELAERFYQTPVDPLKLLTFVETAEPHVVEAITPKLIGKWPNTYTFTKALAEDYLRQFGVGIPLGIYRPSIVISSVKEPIPRWVDNWYGVSGYITACGTGLLRAMQVEPTMEANVVPVDMTVNGMISAAWDVSDRFSEHNRAAMTSRDIRIYNFVLADNPLQWGRLCELARKSGNGCPPVRIIWYHCLFMQRNPIIHRIARVLLHFIPGLCFDTASICMGKKPELLTLYKRIEKMADVTAFFTVRNWNFLNENVIKMITKMTDEDRKLYFCDVRSISWTEYMKGYFLGIRRYLLKDEDATIPTARKRFYKFFIMHTTLKYLLAFLAIRTTVKTILAIRQRLKHIK